MARMKLTCPALLLLCASAFAELPVPDIKGPTERQQGALTFLDASESEGAEHFSWLVDTSSVQVPKSNAPDVSATIAQLRAMGFKVQEPKSDEEPLWAVSFDGKILWLSTYPGEYGVVLGVSNADGLVLMPWRVSVEGGIPPTPPVPPPVPPIPPPVPPVPPVPPIPVPSADMAKLVATELGKTFKPEMMVEFSVLAAVYMAAADDIQSGKLRNVDDALDQVKAESNRAMPTYLAVWMPVVGKVEVKLNELSADGKLTDDVKTYEQPFRDIADGVISAVIGGGASTAEVNAAVQGYMRGVQ